MWYNRTGGLVPMPQQKLTRRQTLGILIRMVPFLTWCLAGTAAESWLTPRIWPVQQHSMPLFALIVSAPLALLVLRLSRKHPMGERIWLEWKTASRRERAVGLWRSRGRSASLYSSQDTRVS